MKREFVRLPQFEKCWSNNGLGEDELCELEHLLYSNPERGPVISGTNGLRKLTWAINNRRKSKGMRVLYVDFVIYEKIYLISAYTKADKLNITDKEKAIYKTMITNLKSLLDEKGG